MKNRAKMLGKNIKTFRKLREWSQEELSHLAELTPSHLGHIERGDCNPTFETLLAISDALQVDISEIVKMSTDVTTQKGGLRLEKLQGDFQALPLDRQREIYGILKTMINWNKE